MGRRARADPIRSRTDQSPGRDARDDADGEEARRPGADGSAREVGEGRTRDEKYDGNRNVSRSALEPLLVAVLVLDEVHLLLVILRLHFRRALLHPVKHPELSLPEGFLEPEPAGA